jgi:hypothetical protein
MDWVPSAMRSGHRPGRHGLCPRVAGPRDHFHSDGNVLGQWGGEEDQSPGGFVSPHGIAIDCRGDVYVGEVLAGARIKNLCDSSLIWSYSGCYTASGRLWMRRNRWCATANGPVVVDAPLDSGIRGASDNLAMSLQLEFSLCRSHLPHEAYRSDQKASVSWHSPSSP